MGDASLGPDPNGLPELIRSHSPFQIWKGLEVKKSRQIQTICHLVIESCRIVDVYFKFCSFWQCLMRNYGMFLSLKVSCIPFMCCRVGECFFKILSFPPTNAFALWQSWRNMSKIPASRILQAYSIEMHRNNKEKETAFIRQTRHPAAFVPSDRKSLRSRDGPKVTCQRNSVDRDVGHVWADSWLHQTR